MNNKVLILGASGMLGHTLFSRLSERNDMDVYATARSTEGLSTWFMPGHIAKVQRNVDADNFDSILRALTDVKPDIVINCIGIIKQLPAAKDPLISITINSIFPHRLALASKAIGARMIHISTDCVFSGHKGNYTEKDFPDATDLYGRTKLLGEVDYPHCITLRTSIIGHELKGKYGLIDWFLSQEGEIQGFSRARYSGFPTVELTRIIADYVIPNTDLMGLYHVSSAPISKYDLLRMVAEQYGKRIIINKNDDFYCDRSLDSSRFRSVTGYNPPAWPDMIHMMCEDAKKKGDI